MTLLAMPAIANDKPNEEAQQDERLVIEQRAKSYAAAYNAKDLSALIAHWAPEGVYIDRASGERVVGREALKKVFQDELASRKESRLEIAAETIELVSPGVALEQGTSTITTADGQPIMTSYSAVHVKRDGQWLIDRISESEIARPPSHYEQLKELEWMIGDWSDQEGDGAVSTECHWARNNNFIIRSFTISIAGGVDMSGMQIVGWDGAKKQIRSWTFDSDGGFNHGVWGKTGDRWSVQQTATLPDGAMASSTTLLTPLDENSFTWQQVNRVVGGQLLPNLEEVVVGRK
jgi:uncharacterized protein (TIGR02246 family)